MSNYRLKLVFLGYFIGKFITKIQFFDGLKKGDLFYLQEIKSFCSSIFLYLALAV